MRRYTVRLNETDYTLDVEEAARDQFVVHLGDRVVNVTLVDHADVAPDEIADGPGAARNVVAAPMPGVVLSVEVAPGAVVTRGQLLLVLEAMKMKNDLHAERDGVIASVSVSAGDQVKHGDPLIAYEG